MNKKVKIDKTILAKIQNKALVRRYIMFIFALVIYAITYNVFFVQTDLILGGSGGIAILFKKFLTPSITIALLSGLSILLSLVLRDRQFVINSIAGAILSPIFVELTKNITINIPKDD